MAGASFAHVAIATKVLAELSQRLAGSGCQPLGSDMRIYTPSTGLFTYPDATVVCGDPQFFNERQLELVNPRVIVEVLSPSTEGYDRGRKFDHYRSLASLAEYVLIAQDRPFVEVRRRAEGDIWKMHFYTGLEGALRIECLGVELPLAVLYKGIVFPGQGQTGTDTNGHAP